MRSASHPHTRCFDTAEQNYYVYFDKSSRGSATFKTRTRFDCKGFQQSKLNYGKSYVLNNGRASNYRELILRMRNLSGHCSFSDSD